MATPNEIRTLLMLLAKQAGDDEAVDRIAEMDDAGIAALASEGDAATFSSGHQDGESWETSGRYYQRAGGETHRVAGPGGDEGGEGESEPAEQPEPAAAAEPASTATPEQPPEGAAQPAEDAPGTYEQALEKIGHTPEERAANIASWVLAPFPQSRHRLADGLNAFFSGNHDVLGIVQEQAGKLAKDAEAPSVERAVAGAIGDLMGGQKPLGQVLRDNLGPIKESFRGDKLKMNAIEGATLALATAINTAVPGLGTAIGGALDEVAHQVIEEGNDDWDSIAGAAVKAATIGIITRRIGKLGRNAGLPGDIVKGASKLAGKVAMKNLHKPPAVEAA